MNFISFEMKWKIYIIDYNQAINSDDILSNIYIAKETEKKFISIYNLKEACVSPKNKINLSLNQINWILSNYRWFYPIKYIENHPLNDFFSNDSVICFNEENDSFSYFNNLLLKKEIKQKNLNILYDMLEKEHLVAQERENLLFRRLKEMEKLNVEKDYQNKKIKLINPKYQKYIILCNLYNEIKEILSNIKNHKITFEENIIYFLELFDKISYFKERIKNWYYQRKNYMIQNGYEKTFSIILQKEGFDESLFDN